MIKMDFYTLKIYNIKINIVSQYEMLFDENKEIIQIKLDNGVNLKIRTMK